MLLVERGKIVVLLNAIIEMLFNMATAGSSTSSSVVAIIYSFLRPISVLYKLVSIVSLVRLQNERPLDFLAAVYRSEIGRSDQLTLSSG